MNRHSVPSAFPVMMPDWVPFLAAAVSHSPSGASEHSPNCAAGSSITQVSSSVERRRIQIPPLRTKNTRSPSGWMAGENGWIGTPSVSWRSGPAGKGVIANSCGDPVRYDTTSRVRPSGVKELCRKYVAWLIDGCDVIWCTTAPVTGSRLEVCSEGNRSPFMGSFEGPAGSSAIHFET